MADCKTTGASASVGTMDGTGADTLAECGCGWGLARWEAQKLGIEQQHDEFNLRRVVRRQAGAHAGNCDNEVTIHV